MSTHWIYLYPLIFHVIDTHIHKLFFQQVIVLNQRKILDDITEVANLHIHSEGSHVASAGTYGAWIKIDIPIPGHRPRRVTTMVTADSTISEEHAAEKAANKAIKMIVQNGNIVIAHLTKTAYQDISLLEEKEQLLTHLAYACLSFDTVLPIQVIRPPAIPGDLSTSTLKYTGNIPPSTHLEQPASFISHSVIGPEYTRIRPKTGTDQPS
jgi:hypothetical protein